MKKVTALALGDMQPRSAVEPPPSRHCSLSHEPTNTCIEVSKPVSAKQVVTVYSFPLPIAVYQTPGDKFSRPPAGVQLKLRPLAASTVLPKRRTALPTTIALALSHTSLSGEGPSTISSWGVDVGMGSGEIPPGFTNVAATAGAFGAVGMAATGCGDVPTIWRTGTSVMVGKEAVGAVAPVGGPMLGAVPFPLVGGRMVGAVAFPPVGGRIVGAVAFPPVGGLILGAVAFPLVGGRIVGAVTFPPVGGPILGAVAFPPVGGRIVGAVAFPPVGGPIVGAVAFPPVGGRIVGAVAFPLVGGRIVGAVGVFPPDG